MATFAAFKPTALLLMRPASFIALLVLVCLFSARCVREVLIDLPEQPQRMVAICHFTPGQPFRIRLQLSQAVNDGRDPATPLVADVSVSEEGLFLDKLFRSSADGAIFWQSRDTVKAGVSYAMAARIAGLPSISATSTVPAHVPLRPISIPQSAFQTLDLNEGYQALRVPLELELSDFDPANPYFAFDLTADIDVLEFVNGVPVVDFSYEGQPAGYTTDGSTLSLLHSIPEPAVLINEKFWSEGRRTLKINALVFYRPLENERPRRLYVKWRTLSEEFYRYHLSVARQGDNLPLSEPDAVFNNVEGGYGNFSGYSISTDTIELPQQ
jgi:hypothetical protein